MTVKKDSPVTPEPVPPAPELIDGASATDPSIHWLLAERQTAAMNGDPVRADALTTQLNEMGYR